MSTVRQTLVLQDKMSKTLSSINKAMHSTLYAMKAVKSENVGVAFDAIEKEAKEADRALAEFNEELKQQKKHLNDSNSGLSSSIKKYLSLGAAVVGAKKVMDLTDTYTSNQARLSLIVREGEDLVKVNDMIYQSAQKSRTGYMDMQASVAKLGQTASKSFDSTAEIVRFTELLNKNFVVGGASATEQASAMYQLTQAMGSGKLQGDEYRSIIENAPLLAKSIEDYMRNVQKAKGSMKDWASEGLLTADVIKAALFSSADDIEKKYAEMPLTFSQAWTLFKNSATRAFEPVLKLISKILQGFSVVFDFLAEHTYIFYVIGGAILGLAAVWLILNAATIATTISQWALNSAMLACPLTWIVLAVAALIGVLMYLWNTNDNVAYGMLLAWDSLTTGMMLVKILFMKIWDGIATHIETKVGNILMNIENLVNGSIKLINMFINAINDLTGASLSTVDYVATFGTDFVRETTANQAKRDLDIIQAEKDYYNRIQELNQSRDERVQNRKKVGMENVYGADLTGLVGTDASGGKALKTTSKDKLLSDEDIQLLLDIATRDYQLSYQSVTPNISVQFGDVRETADVDGVMDVIAGRIEDIINGDAEVNE